MIFTLFHTFPHFFRIFPPGLSPSKQRVLAQWQQKIRIMNKKNWTNRCCTLVVARLSSSYSRPKFTPKIVGIPLQLPILVDVSDFFSVRGRGKGIRSHLLALFESPSGGGLTKMGSVTFWGPLDTSFLFAQIVGARCPQKASVFGPQNLALCEVLGSKCDRNKCGKYSGKFVKLVFAR